MDDPDAPGKTFVHWVLWNLEVHDGKAIIDEGISRRASCCQQGINDLGRIGYDGPCPPKGHGIHHYHIKVYALDTRLSLPHSTTKDMLLSSMENHIVGQTEIVGLFERK